MNNRKIIRQFINYINPEKDIDDFAAIHSGIEKDVVFKGTNIWILMFAVIVASVGLNMNSTAVIIGAMLISPLMGPINGIGYSIATYDFPLFRIAFRNCALAVIASLAASTMYFMISPLSTAHSELLARTSPTIYDVLIALFGGLAGIVAISSRQKGNVVPGVAIATALMPPLCTAGYGLATAQFDFFLGAAYLFLINAAFIAFAAMAITKILKFPINAQVGDKSKKNINRWITAIITLIFIPSIYFGYRLVQKERFLELAKIYVESVSAIEGNYLLKHEIKPEQKSIVLTYGGSSLTWEQKMRIKDQAGDFRLNDADIIFRQGLSFGDSGKHSSEIYRLNAEVIRINGLLREKEQTLDSISRQKQTGKMLLREISSLFPGIKECTYAEAERYHATTYDPRKSDIIIFGVGKENLPDAKEREKITDWLKARLQNTHIRVFFEHEQEAFMRK